MHLRAAYSATTPLRTFAAIVAACVAGTLSCGTGSGGEPSSRAGTPQQAELKAPGAPAAPARSLTLADHVVLAAKLVRETLGDTALPDPAGIRPALDTLILKLSSQLFMVSSPATIINEINRELFAVRKLGFDRDDRSLAGMFPHTVLKQGQGSCVGLSLLYLLAAERMDIPLNGVLVPQHFFVRFQSPDTMVNIEPIKQGQCFNNDWYRTKYSIGPSSPYYDLAGLDKQATVAVVQYNLGNVFREHGKLEAAVECYQTCVEQLPGFAEAWGNMGVALEAMGEHERALSAMEKARAIDPSLKNIARNIGTLQLRLSRDREAVSEFRTAVGRDGTNADNLYGLALALFRTGAYEESVRYATEALRVRPEMAEAGTLIERARARTN